MKKILFVMNTLECGGAEKALISIGEKDLREIYEDGKNEELKCHFCNKTYVFTPEEIGRLLANSNKSE